MKKISVIIPVYNVEKYLDDCLSDVTGQSYTNLQIILIDDGSTDKSGALCDKWAARDSRIWVVHTANKGLSSARNTGLQAADGEYISFVDSDDRIHHRFLEWMAAALEDKNADIAVCREQTFVNDVPPEQSLPHYHMDCSESQSEFLTHFMDSFTGPACWVWNKLYRRELLKGLSFPIGRKMEDIYFSSDVALQCRSVVWISDRLYYYRQHAGSIMSMGNSDIAPDYIAALTYSLNRFQSIPLIAADYPAYVLNKIALLCVKSKKKGFHESMKEGFSHFCSLYDSCHKNVHGCKNRCKLFLARYTFPLYYFLRKTSVSV